MSKKIKAKKYQMPKTILSKRIQVTFWSAKNFGEKSKKAKFSQKYVGQQKLGKKISGH